MADFKLVLNNPPQGAFIRGNNISGTIDIRSDEVHTNYQAIRISLKGYSDVHWTETHTSTDGNGRSTSRTVSYHSHENYIDAFADVWSRQTAPGGVFPAGHFQYPFTIPLNAPRLPSSFEGHHGHIRYNVEACILKSGFFSSDVKAVARVNMVNTVDPNRPELQRPVALRMEKTVGCLCCESAPILITASLPRTGYCIGRDAIQMEVEVENGSGNEVRYIIATLQKTVQFIAQGHTKNSVNTIASMTSHSFRPHSTHVWKPDPMMIPGTEPTLDLQQCSNISITYYLKFTAAIAGVVVNPSLHIPVFLGNIPINQQGQQPLPIFHHPGPQGGPPMGGPPLGLDHPINQQGQQPPPIFHHPSPQGGPPMGGPPLGLDHLATGRPAT